jgi:hypothetical protein
MEIAFYLAVPLLAAIALLWVVNRRNPGDFRPRKDVHERAWDDTDTHWGGKVDPDRRQGRS